MHTHTITLATTLVLTCSAAAQDAPPEPPPVWAKLDGRAFYDGTWAGARYEFSTTAAGKPVARHVVYGSGVPVIADATFPVDFDGAVVVLTNAEAVLGDAPREVTRRYRYDLQAGVLRLEGDSAARLVPLAGDQPVWAPLLAKLKLATPAAAVGALTHADPVVRREAVLFLARHRVATKAQPRFPEVVALFADPVADVQAAAAWAAGYCREASAEAALKALAESADPAVQREASRALDRLRPSRR